MSLTPNADGEIINHTVDGETNRSEVINEPGVSGEREAAGAAAANERGGKGEGARRRKM